jgi:hypothetical protein
MNPDQEQKLAQINDSYGVASWRQVGNNIIVKCDDGDEATIYPDGSANWMSGGRITSRV